MTLILILLKKDCCQDQWTICEPKTLWEKDREKKSIYVSLLCNGILNNGLYFTTQNFWRLNFYVVITPKKYRHVHYYIGHEIKQFALIVGWHDKVGWRNNWFKSMPLQSCLLKLFVSSPRTFWLMHSVKTRISILGQWYSKGQDKKIFKWIYLKTAIEVIRKLSFFLPDGN